MKTARQLIDEGQDAQDRLGTCLARYNLLHDRFTPTMDKFIAAVYQRVPSLPKHEAVAILDEMGKFLDYAVEMAEAVDGVTQAVVGALDNSKAKMELLIASREHPELLDA